MLILPMFCSQNQVALGCTECFCKPAQFDIDAELDTNTGLYTAGLDTYNFVWLFAVLHDVELIIDTRRRLKEAQHRLDGLSQDGELPGNDSNQPNVAAQLADRDRRERPAMEQQRTGRLGAARRRLCYLRLC